MATKDSMRAEILALEPDNEIVGQTKISHADLKTELTATKRRKQAKAASSALPAVAVYRLEDNNLICWRLCRRDTLASLMPLEYGDQLPIIGELIAVNPDEGVTARVSSHRQGLNITTGDLPVRENFDARRIYVTPNGTNVVYMRQERSRVVLWSFKIQAEIMLGGNVPLERTDRKSQPVARKKRKMTQKLLASYLIASNPDVLPNELTGLLKEAFPSANISLEGRHGPHYLSLSRNGKLPIAPEDDPRTW